MVASLVSLSLWKVLEHDGIPQEKARESNLNERSKGERERRRGDLFLQGARWEEIKSLSAFLGHIISSYGEDSGREEKERWRGSRTISLGSQSKTSEHIFSNLELGTSIGYRGISVCRARIFLLSFPSSISLSLSLPHFSFFSFSSFLVLSFSYFFSLSILFSISSTCLLRSPRSKHADANNPVRGVSSEMKGGN